MSLDNEHIEILYNHLHSKPHNYSKYFNELLELINIDNRTIYIK